MPVHWVWVDVDTAKQQDGRSVHVVFDPRRGVERLVCKAHSVRPQVGRDCGWPPAMSVDEHGARRLLQVPDALLCSAILVVGVTPKKDKPCSFSVQLLRHRCAVNTPLSQW
jgi:hypothetical protein